MRSAHAHALLGCNLLGCVWRRPLHNAAMAAVAARHLSRLCTARAHRRRALPIAPPRPALSRLARARSPPQQQLQGLHLHGV